MPPRTPSSDKSRLAATAWNTTKNTAWMWIGTTVHITTPTASPTTRPRDTPPAAKPSASSQGLSGGISTSTILPCTLEISSDDEVLAKAFCTIAIMISPGPRNSAKVTPPTDETARPSASVKMARNSSVVISGASTVWVATLTKRRTSLR